jgi:hypothetical protein
MGHRVLLLQLLALPLRRLRRRLLWRVFWRRHKLPAETLLQPPRELPRQSLRQPADGGQLLSD